MNTETTTKPETIPPLPPAHGSDYVGPCKIECDQKCDVPAGVVLYPVPRPRHNWSDCIHCPNCERSFMVMKRSSPNEKGQR